MAKPRVFISREISSTSPLLALSDKFEVIGASLLDFKTIYFEEKPPSDWVFFYSQQGVRHFVVQSSVDLISAKVAAFGPATASLLRSHGIKPTFIGNGKAHLTSHAFAPLADHQSVLFIRAKNSRKSVQKLLSDSSITTYDLVVYDNFPKKNISLPTCKILFFTSPLNAKCYYDKYPMQADQIILAIGRTTQHALKILGASNVLASENASEEAIKEAIMQLDLS